MFRVLSISIVLIGIGFNMNAQVWKTPTIEGYGRIMEFEDVAIKPDSTKEYKVLFHITSDKEREGVNASLWKMARLINLLEDSGVPKRNIHLVGVISGAATPITLSEESYFKKLHKSNPNLDLMKKLTDYKVIIHLCGQAAAKNDVDPKTDLNPYTKLTLSALIDIPTYQMQGYVVMF
ncbi:hypothetical protein EI546_10030 [Aequorivita sp. H23M31]|uniref:Uncharacterized protein n=1 Tax=Aequorivita ciconiae TaxID=2494375 RepID=A0A410G476_9FLAO|nr:DsrE family protein [Aequorivita sp. H23M31]QAA82041.1 hypothetical protein EI546_10030 [Aequorivita sp. H23M31]